MIEILPGSLVSARAVLAKTLEEAEDGDVVFVVLLKGEDATIRSSAFATRDLCWAAKLLDAHALAQVVEP